jgi:MFS family permease
MGIDMDSVARTSAPAGSAGCSEIRQHWCAVLACFVTAIFAWGFGFYGQSVYLPALRQNRGWSAFLISSATTAFYLAGAVVVTQAHTAIARFGARAVLICGAVLLGVGAVLFCSCHAPWQLYSAALVMACGWACTTMAAAMVYLTNPYTRGSYVRQDQSQREPSD